MPFFGQCPSCGATKWQPSEQNQTEQCDTCTRDKVPMPSAALESEPAPAPAKGRAK